MLPDFAQPANPLDVTGSGFASGMDKVVKILLEDENIDILIPVSFPPSSQMDTWADGFNQSFLPMLHTAGKPVIPITFREVSDYARHYYRDHEHILYRSRRRRLQGSFPFNQVCTVSKEIAQ